MARIDRKENDMDVQILEGILFVIIPFLIQYGGV